MPAINKTPPLLLKKPANGTREAENTEHTQINKQEDHTPNSKEQQQNVMTNLLLLLQLLTETSTESKKGEDEGSETRDSDPEDHRRSVQDLANTKSTNAYDINSRKKRASKGRVFQCTGYPDCNMSFTRSEHLARHKRKHTGERPFRCPHCHKNFSRLDNLRQHKQTVHAYESFMDGGSNNIPISTNYNSEGKSGNMKTNNTNYMPIPNLTRNSSVNKGTPESPLSFGVGNTPESAAMISPPNTNSPINYHLPYQNQFYKNNSYDAVNSSGNNSFQYPDSQLKTKINEFKPKRRPRPLSLVHSFTENMAPGDNNSLHIRQLLKSAPALYTTNGAFTYPPKSAPLTPNMVSPLSPLFRHAFNQSMDLPNSPNINSNTLRLPPYNHPVNNNNIPNNPANKNITLPSVQELPIPTQFNPIKSSKTSKTWLKEVLNDESAASSSTTNHISHLQPTQEDKQLSKKPTINNLLSPYDDDEFPNSVI